MTPAYLNLWQKVPRRLQRAIRYVVYLYTRSPALGTRAAEELAKQGHHGRARKLFLQCRQSVLSASYRRDMPVIRFAIERGLYAYGLNENRDSLFSCRLRSSGDPHLEDCYGLFGCQFAYNGLVVEGEVFAATAGGHQVQIRVNDRLVRTIQLRFKSGSGHFRFIIKRPVLDTFPVESEIAVVIPGGGRLSSEGGTAIGVQVPHGSGSLFSEIEARGLLDKKGHFKQTAAELEHRHATYLSLYKHAREIFDHRLSMPLMLMYGTLLGQHRDGDIIPWDDDFDVGYFSGHSNPARVKAEARDVIWALLGCGYEVLLKRDLSTSFRVRVRGGNAEEHLAVRPVWHQDGRIWAEIKASLALSPGDFQAVTTELRGTKVYVPRGTEAFLAAYYGENWRVPDKGYSNSTMRTPVAVKSNLERSRFTVEELLSMKKAADEQRRIQPEFGELICIGMSDLYPLEVFERRFGW